MSSSDAARAAPDAMVSKIRRLLTKAESAGCTPAEAAALTDKAMDLIAKYGVDRTMLAAADPSTNLVGDRVIAVPAPAALDKACLLATVAKELGCESVRRDLRTSGRGGEYEMHLFGFASDLERAELLYSSLLIQASYGLAAAASGRHDTESSGEFRRAWLTGFSRAVGERLHAAEHRAAAEQDHRHPRDGGPSVALLRPERSQAVLQQVMRAYPRLGRPRPLEVLDSGFQLSTPREN